MKSGYKKLVCVLLIVLLVLPSAGCSAAKKLFRHESAAAKDSTDVGYQIYYIDSSGLELYPYAYKLEATKECAGRRRLRTGARHGCAAAEI